MQDFDATRVHGVRAAAPAPASRRFQSLAMTSAHSPDCTNCSSPECHSGQISMHPPRRWVRGGERYTWFSDDQRCARHGIAMQVNATLTQHSRVQLSSRTQQSCGPGCGGVSPAGKLSRNRPGRSWSDTAVTSSAGWHDMCSGMAGGGSPEMFRLGTSTIEQKHDPPVNIAAGTRSSG